MQWWIALLGLLVLIGLAFGVRKRPLLSYRDVPLEDELLPHVATLAARQELRGRGKIRLSRGLLGFVTRRIRYMNRRSKEDLLPAAQWLSDNGRFLQETIAQLTLESSPPLPRTNSGELRLLCLARELIGHTNADLTQENICRIVEAWQKQEALTNDEICCLPLALKTILIGILTEMTDRCEKDQRAYDLAPRFAEALLSHRNNRMMRRFETYKSSPPFLERLLSILRTCEDAGAIEWLEKNAAPQDRQLGEIAELEHNRQTENCLWIGNAITSLRLVDLLPWHKLCEQFSRVHDALSADATYPRMDEESRAYYRRQVVRFSRAADVPELTVCNAALTLAASGEEVASHVGYYLLDDGRDALLSALHVQGAQAFRMRLPYRYAFPLYRAGEWIVYVALLVIGFFGGISPWVLLPFGVVFLQPYRLLWLRLAERLLPPRMAPRILVEQLTDAERTLIVCPTLISDREQALAMVKRLSMLHQANPDPKLDFMLLGDPRESLTAAVNDDDEIIQTAAAAIQTLCEDTGHRFI